MKKLIVMLHGVGSSGADLEGLGLFAQQVMPVRGISHALH